VFFILLQFAESFGAFYALMLVTAFFGEAYRPALTTLVGTYSRPGETGRSIAFLRLAINLGMSAAPALGGLIALQLGYPYLFWIDGITCIAAALLFGWLAAGWQGNQVGEGEEKKVEDSPSSPSLPPHRQPAFLLFLVSTLLFGLVFVQGYFTLPVFLKSEWQYNEDLIGLLMGFSSFMIVLVEMPLVHSLEKSGKVRLSVLWGMALLGICFLPFLLPEALWLAFFVMFIYTMGEILYLPFNNILPLEMAPKGKQGEYLAWYWMTWSLCNILGPGLGLGIAGVWGYPKLWLVLLGMAGLSWVLMRKGGEKVPRSSQGS
jgi:MFS family permease